MTALGQAAVFLIAAVIAVPLFRRFRISSVLAYLASGMVIGPWGLGLIQNVEATLHVAELGVVMLLFVIGLELQPSRLRVMRKTALVLGLSQMVVTTAALLGIGVLLHIPFNAALIGSFALALSSTPLVLQLLAERNQLATQHGRASFAVLIFQDIAVMPMLALLPMLGTGSSAAVGADAAASVAAAAGAAAGVHDWSVNVWSLLKGVALLAAVVFGGRYLLRPLLRRAAETGIREVFSATTLLVVVGTALLASSVGLSMALGAFVAGVLLADSEYRHELEADIEPFKGLLLGLFFIGVGMGANLSLVVSQPVVLFGGVLLLFAVKIGALWVTARVTGQSAETARGLAFALPQAGEFGFVLFAIAVANGVMQQSLADSLVLVVTLSMALSPLLMSFQTRVLEPWLNPAVQRPFDTPQEDGSRVIIAGFGRFGQIVGRVLRMRKIRFTALEASPAQVDFVRRFGNKVYYGDASRLELLESAGIAKAEILVVAMDDVEASVRTVELMNAHYPQVKLFARARNRQHALRLMELGVRYIIRETLLSSLDMSQRVLESLGLTRKDALESITRFRTSDDKTLLDQLQYKDDEQKLMQSAQLAARELERLFEADTDKVAAEERSVALEDS